MKKIYMLFLGLCLITLAEAQVSKTLEVTSGNLSSLLTEEEKSTITSSARIASKGYGETAPLYNPDVTEQQKAANRRVEIRLVPFRA
jgi:hypothetical protein